MKTDRTIGDDFQISLNPETWVDRYGNALYAYTLIRVSQPGLAEEIVQEAFLAALGAQTRFKGRSSEKTWLFGILKHKIVDHFRKVGRERPLLRKSFRGSPVDKIFDRKGNWVNGPEKWTFDPGNALEQKEFFNTLCHCLEKLPLRLARVFILKEMDGLGSKKICDLMEISSNNLYVMLHRARLQLRHQLEQVWCGATQKNQNTLNPSLMDCWDQIPFVFS